MIRREREKERKGKKGKKPAKKKTTVVGRPARRPVAVVPAPP